MFEKFFELFEDFYKDENKDERDNLYLALILNSVSDGTQGV